jgi:O-antigen/teichoic acid export membrane protein
MARLYGAGEAASVRRLLQNSTEWLIFLLGLLCGLVIINAGTIIGLLFQPEYRQATVAMQLIVLSAYITMVSNPAIDALSSTQYIRIPTIASWLALAVSLGSWFLLIPSLGINGAAAGYLAGAIVSGGMPTVFAYRRYGMRAIMFLRATVIFGALIIAMLVPGHFQPITSALFAVLVCALYARTGRSGLQQLLAKYGRSGWRRSKASVPPP